VQRPSLVVRPELGQSSAVSQWSRCIVDHEKGIVGSSSRADIQIGKAVPHATVGPPAIVVAAARRRPGRIQASVLVKKPPMLRPKAVTAVRSMQPSSSRRSTMASTTSRSGLLGVRSHALLPDESGTAVSAA
jgi:hypothetical protein